jgi:ribosomal protein L29
MLSLDEAREISDDELQKKLSDLSRTGGR